MRDQIIKKLQHELAEELVKESQVVYVLVEVRKLLDHSSSIQPTNEFKALRMFCDWVVHVSLTGYGKGSILDDFDNAYAEHRKWREMEKTHDAYSLKALRDELRQFARVKDLPTGFVDDGVAWGRFLKLYASVVSECPLVYRPNHRPKYIESATLRIREIPEDAIIEDQAKVGVQWDWEFRLQGGRVHTLRYRYIF
jgi:hypothetical protein